MVRHSLIVEVKTSSDIDTAAVITALEAIITSRIVMGKNKHGIAALTIRTPDGFHTLEVG